MGYIKNLYHFFLAWAGSIFYRYPSRELVVIGITGTKGKTTSAELLHAVLQKAGKRTALLSSASVAFGDEREPRGGNTMPGRFFMQKFLREAVQRGCTHAVFEVTSQGVVQHRHRFIDFDAAALTCLHPEHIESHGSYEAYRGAKVQFFKDVATRSLKKNKLFFINTETGGDAQFFEESVRHPVGAGNFGKVVFYNHESFIRNALEKDRGRVSEWLRSDFNLQNAALVYEMALALGVSSSDVLSAFKDFRGVAGRLEFVKGAGRTAVIDYALTPESLRQLYQHLLSVIASTRSNPGLDSEPRLPREYPRNDRQGKLIAVFGSAGGGRDTWKRPALGKVADEFCDTIYLTTDDSYDEDPQAIIADIQKGIPSAGKVIVIVDRKEAIAAALKSAGPNDIVVITGMGSQQHTYGPKGAKLPWSEREAVLEAMGRL